MRNAKALQLINALEPRACQSGLELVDVEIVGKGSSPIIRIYLDGDDGITLDQISAANRWIDEIVESIDPFPGAYTLEVSSPGIDRPLRTREHFERFAGEQASVVTAKHGEGGRSTWTGELKGMSGDDVVLDVDGEEVRVSFDLIKKAHVIGQVDFSTKSDEELFGDTSDL